MNEENSSLNSENELEFTKIDIDNVPWIICRYVFENNREHGYKIHQGDIFKLGKFILKVKELGLEYEEDKKLIFDRNNTQKFSKNKIISVNNISQIPLNDNQQEDDYGRVLNLNINKNSAVNNNINININENNNNIKSSENESYNGNNIHIIENENEESKSESNSNENKSFPDSSKLSSSSNNNDENNKESNKGDNNELNNNKSKNSSKSNSKNDDNNLNFASVVNANQENFNNLNDNNINNNIISIYYNNQKNNNNEKNINLISNNANNININNINGDNKNLYFINIIKNNSASNDSKSKVNTNSFKVNSLGFNTFNKESFKNSSINKSNFQSLKLDETINENTNINIDVNRNNKKYLTVLSTSKLQIDKNPTKELKSTASFNKQKVLEMIQKKILESGNNTKPLCRICLSEEHIKENPLIHPCNCDGTMKYIHLQCLRLLIQSKIKKTETDSCKVLTFKKLECEICKTSFPEKISIKGSSYSIIDIDKPDKDYIILEGLIREQPEEKSIFIVHFKNKKEIKIGRATDSNIRLNDISVSRAHAMISQYNNNFYLHDTNAKFGTLIRMKNKFKILANKPFYVQKGNTFYEFIMKKTLWAYFKCYKQKNDIYNNYNEFLDEISYNKYLFKKDDEILIDEKTKSVSEYSSEVIKYNKIDVKSIKSFNRNENKLKDINKININKVKDNNDNDKENAQQILNFDSFRFNKQKKRNNNVINNIQENSNIIKNDLTKSKSKEDLTIEEQANYFSISLNNNINK